MNKSEMVLAERIAKALAVEVENVENTAFVTLLEKLVEVNERHTKALKFYAKKENYECEDDTLDPSVSYIHIVDMDSGEEARKALGEE
jgi:hypothetical protein